MSTNRQQIEQLFNNNRKLLLGVAQRYVPDADLAQDVIQQSFAEFIGLHEKKSWPLTEDIVPLLVQITKYAAHRIWKNAERHKPKALERIEYHLRNYYQCQEEPQESDKDNDSVDRLYHCLDRLPSKSRQIIDLRYFLDHSTKDIAAMYHVEENSIFKSLARIRAKLKECISPTSPKNDENDSR